MKKMISLVFGAMLFFTNLQAFEPEEAVILEKVDEIYQEALLEGVTNFYALENTKLMTLFNSVLATTFAKAKVGKFMDLYEGYLDQLVLLCEEHDDHELSKKVSAELEEFLEDFDRTKIAHVLLFQMGVGVSISSEDLAQLRSLAVEYMVKNRIAADLYEEESESFYVRSLLEREKLVKIRGICTEAEDAYMREFYLEELLVIHSLKDYLDKYTFRIDHHLSPEDEGVSEAEAAFKELHLDFLEKLEALKNQYRDYVAL